MTFECAARRQGTAGGNDPADCDWPHCDCDAGRERRVRHKKRGSTYRVIGLATIQSGEPIQDMAEIILYQSEDDGRIWARTPFEFEDGRFEDRPRQKRRQSDLVPLILPQESVNHLPMVSILITAAAYEAIRALIDVERAPPAAEDGEKIKIWLTHDVINRLRAMRGPGEDFSDVILRLASAEWE
jgi:hypothetical protein